MKKSLIYTSTASLALLAGVTTTILIDSASAETTSIDAADTVLALTDQTALGTAITPSKDETVYITTDDAGAPAKTFIGSTLDSSQPDLPVTLNITYALDGTELSATDLAGKSGHVKITYTYASTKTYQNKLVPFLALTGLQLDGNKFTNLKITNGKIISEGDNIIIAGYAFAGLSENLNTDLIPNFFTLEADVTSFELGTTYTLATSQIFADLDTSKLTTVDELVDSMNQLGSGIDQILAGATQLDDGIAQLAAGINKLQSGANALDSGASQLASGAATISTNTSKLAAGAERLSNGLSSLVAIDDQVLSYVNPAAAKVDSGIATLRQKIAELAEVDPELASQLAQALNEVNGYYGEVYGAVISYADSVKDLAAGANQLSTGLSGLADGTAQLASGASTLAAGATELKSGADQLAAGSTQLQSGSQALTSGIATFKAEGIDRLVNFAEDDLATFTANLRSSVNAAKSYHSYKSPSATSTKFIFKTPSIK